MFPFHFFSIIWLVIFWGLLIYVFQEIRHRKIVNKNNSDFENDLVNLNDEFEKGNILIDEYKRRKKFLEKKYKK